MSTQIEKVRIEDSKQYHGILSDLCVSILKLETKITFATVINEKGRIEEFQTRGSILDFFSPPKREAFFMEFALQHSMRKEYDEDFGQVGYTCDIRKKRILFSFPMMNFLLVIGCKHGINSAIVANKIMQSLNNSCTIIKSENEEYGSKKEFEYASSC